MSKSKLKRYLTGSRTRTVIFVGAFGVTGALILVLSQAATPTASIEAEAGLKSANAQDLTGNSSSANGYVKFTAGGTTTPSGWPDASNTGYTHAPECPNGLTSVYSGGAIVKVANDQPQVFNCVDFPNPVLIGRSGDTSTYPTNVTFNGCRFRNNDLNGIPIEQWYPLADELVSNFGNNITFNYSSFTPSPELATAPPVAHVKGWGMGIHHYVTGKMTVNHSDFWGGAVGIQIGGSDQTRPVTINNSWFHDPRSDGTELGLDDSDHNRTRPTSDHTDGILENWGDGGQFPEKYITINHNRILSADGNTNAIALQGNVYDHLIVNNNYVSGFNVTVDIGAQLTNSQFIGNVYGSDYRGTFYDDNGDPFQSQMLNHTDALPGRITSGQLTWCANTYNRVTGGMWSPFPTSGSYWWASDVFYDPPVSNGTAHTTDDPRQSGGCPAHPIPS